MKREGGLWTGVAEPQNEPQNQDASVVDVAVVVDVGVVAAVVDVGVVAVVVDVGTSHDAEHLRQAEQGPEEELRFEVLLSF